MGILPKREVYCWVLVFFIFTLVYLPTTRRPLRNAESKYAEIPREMIDTGDWITPHLDYTNYYTKPPLTFWVTALAYKIFGVHPWVARMTNIGWAFLAALLTGLMAYKMYGQWAGPITSAVFLLSSEVFAYCLDAGIEFGLISCNIASLFFFWLYIDNGVANKGTPHNRLLYLRLFYICLGLSFLAKGILGLALPIAILFFYLIISKDIHNIKRFLDPIGIFLLAVFILPWVILMCIRHPDFLRCFIINEHIGRLTGTLDSHDSLFPTWLFLAHVAGEFFPWIVFTPVIILMAIECFRRGENDRKKIRYLISWALVPLFLFSVSRCKVDFYGLHVYPPLFIIFSVAIKDLLEGRSKVPIGWWKYPWLLLSVTALISFFILILKSNSHSIEALGIPSIRVAKKFMLTSILFGALIYLQISRYKIKSAFILLAIYMFIFFCFTEEMYVADFAIDSMKFASDIYNKNTGDKRDALLFSDELPEFAHIAILPFYTGRPAYLLRNNKNSRLNLAQKDRMEICFNEKDFVKLVHKNIRIYFVGKTEKTKKRFGRLGIHYNIIGRNDGKALFLIN